MSPRRICLDLDGVIAEFKKESETYADVGVIKGAKERIHELKKAGHYIIINTARHMKTCEGNLGKVNARITSMTLNWLDKHEIPYDEIYFGKPWADIYIDDNAFRFEDWHSIAHDGSNLPEHNENLAGK